MRPADWIVVVFYFAYVLWEGVRHGRRNADLDDYFRGRRSLRWWAVGLSVMATQASAITYIGTTGQAYGSGMSFIQFYLPQPLVMIVLCLTFVPFFYRANVYTAYEYLERRFDARTRSLTSLLFLVSRGLATSMVLYASAVVLAAMLGWGEVATILVMALITVAYTTVGGNKAVILVDAKQMILMFAGIFVALGLFIAGFPAGFTLGDAVRLAGATHKWNNIDLSVDLNNPYTLLSGMVGGFFLALAYFGCDQSQVQRYLTGRSLSESRMSLVFNAFVKVPMQFLILAIGVLMFVFFHFQPAPLNFNGSYDRLLAERAGAEYSALQSEYEAAFEQRKEAALDIDRSRQRYLSAQSALERVRLSNETLLRRVLGREPSSDVNYIFPWFLLHHVPAGLLGMMLAVIFAAAMSTFSSEINSLASATVMDFYKRYLLPEATDRHYLRVSRGATVFWGAFAAAAACYAGRLGSLIEAVNKVGSYFYSPILGVFLLAFVVRRSNSTGAFWGLVAGEVAVLWVALFTSVAWLYYNVVGVVVVLLAGTLLSLSRK